MAIEVVDPDGRPVADIIREIIEKARATQLQGLAIFEESDEGEPDEAREAQRRHLWSVPTFEETIADHYSQMVVNARHLTGDVSRADDVVQESMIRAMRGWDRFLASFDTYRAENEGADLDDSIGVWLHGIVTNAFVTMYHHGKRARRRVRELAERPASTVDPREHCDLDGEVATVLAGLDADDRQVLEMHYLQEMDVTEIAVELGCSKSTVFTRLARARKRARQTLP